MVSIIKMTDWYKEFRLSFEKYELEMKMRKEYEGRVQKKAEEFEAYLKNMREKEVERRAEGEEIEFLPGNLVEDIKQSPAEYHINN